MQETLKSVVDYNNYMYVTDVQPGGKTGTTNDQYDIWFDGFTPTYAASIWIGTDENVEMSSMSTPAAALWGKIINQLAKAKDGEYPAAPANVVQKGGEYFTKGTETGLTSWSSKEQKKKDRDSAYKKWLKERENHKVKVIDVPEHDEPVYETQKVQVGTKTVVDQNGQAAWDEKIEHPPEYDADGNIIKEAWTETIHHDAIPEKTHEEPVYETKSVQTGTKHINEVWHYEYEPGWRDGDFSYKGD